MRPRAPRSSVVDVLEHVTDGGVHVEYTSRPAETRESSREGALGGVMSSEVGSQSHSIESSREPNKPLRRRTDR